jgi:hypothetical protein
MGKLVLFLPDGTAQDIKLIASGSSSAPSGQRRLHSAGARERRTRGGRAILDDSFLEDLGGTNAPSSTASRSPSIFCTIVMKSTSGARSRLLDDATAKVAAPPRRPERAHGAPKAESAATSRGERDIRRSDGLMAISGQAVDAIQRVVAAEIESATSEPLTVTPPSAEAASVPAPPVQPPASTHAIRVLTGSSSGRFMALSGSETVIGRAGIQVAALRRIGEDIVVVPIEGATPPNINGSPVVIDGQSFVVGDILEIAGSTLELVLSADVAR